jgi:TctA family transporter
MEALTLLAHGFAVLLTWKILSLMVIGLLLGIFVGVLPGGRAEQGGDSVAAHLYDGSTSAIVMLSCIYWGALFGGAIHIDSVQHSRRRSVATT